MVSKRPISLALSLIFGLGALGFYPDDVLAQQTSVVDEQDREKSSKNTNEQQLPVIEVKSSAEQESKTSLRATTTNIGKGTQAIRDIPQSITVITERLIDDRNLDTLKDALKNTAGASFQAAEGGEEDIRLRGFSLQSTGDIFIDGMRDPAFYDRDSFNWDRLEILRGSASMLFGRGSTGGAVNQVSKKPQLFSQQELQLTLGSGDYKRAQADINVNTGENAAFRINAMATKADNYGNRIDSRGIAPSFRWGIGTLDEFQVSLYHLNSDNGINYGLPWLTPDAKSGGDFLWPTDPKNYYGAASDFVNTGTTQGNLSYIHRFNDGGEIKTALRVAKYERDQRASAVRFAPANMQPGGLAVTSDTFSDATRLRRGSQNKKMEMDTAYLQSDYSGKTKWFGVENALQTGIDFGKENFDNYSFGGAVSAKPNTFVGTPNDGGGTNEGLRTSSVNRSFESQAVGLYGQDLISITEKWKVLAGLRWDTFGGNYTAITAQGQPPCGTPANTELSREDSLLSKRVGLIFQPNKQFSYHLSYGTSFNTSGDTYQYDAGTSQTDPESSRNLELGGSFESASGNLSTRVALFHSTKYNERNRDSVSVNACNYVLSGKRHAAGVEADVAGRITPAWDIYLSMSFIPIANVDSSSGAAGTEIVDSRPGLTPKFSMSLWSTYQLTRQFRVGGGVNARSQDVPVGLAATSAIYAPAFTTAELMAEYGYGNWLFKANVNNITNEHYADVFYRGHYVPGKPRGLEVTASYLF